MPMHKTQTLLYMAAILLPLALAANLSLVRGL